MQHCLEEIKDQHVWDLSTDVRWKGSMMWMWSNKCWALSLAFLYAERISLRECTFAVLWGPENQLMSRDSWFGLVSVCARCSISLLCISQHRSQSLGRFWCCTGPNCSRRKIWRGESKYCTHTLRGVFLRRERALAAPTRSRTQLQLFKCCCWPFGRCNIGDWRAARVLMLL